MKASTVTRNVSTIPRKATNAHLLIVLLGMAVLALVALSEWNAGPEPQTTGTPQMNSEAYR